MPCGDFQALPSGSIAGATLLEKCYSLLNLEDDLASGGVQEHVLYLKARAPLAFSISLGTFLKRKCSLTQQPQGTFTLTAIRLNI